MTFNEFKTEFLATVHLDEYVVNKSENTDIFEKYYVDTNTVKVDLPNKKRNLILIYL